MMPQVIFKNGEFDRAIKMNKENTEDVSRGCITVIIKINREIINYAPKKLVIPVIVVLSAVLSFYAAS